MSQTENPLLVPSSLPNQAPAFNLIKEKHYLPALRTAIAEAKENIKKIKDNPRPPDFDNTIVALECAAETMGMALGVFHNMHGVIKTERLHKLSEKIGPLSANFSSRISQDKKLFGRIKKVWKNRDKLNLSPEQFTLLENTYKSFVRNGALLDAANKKRLREINERLSVLSPSFSNNVSESSKKFELRITDEKDLKGLPDSAIEGARHAAEEKKYKGEYLFTLDYPSFGPFMQYADNRALRETIWRAFSNRAYGDAFDNSANVLEIAKLRHERARLLGYDTHAAYVLEERMAKTSKGVMDFLDRLKSAYKPAALRDFAQLEDFARKNGGPDKLQPWDVAYYSEKLKHKLYDFSSEDLRPYFPLQKVLDGCFTHFSKLFGVKFVPSASYPVWHKDVQAFDVTDKTSGSFVGTLYADFYPRMGSKSPGAWMTSFRDQGLFGGKVERPVIAIVCNFTKPTKEKPSLLTHDEVLTLFHEMGHAMHGMLSNVTYQSVAGTNVKWDFVELPSQVQENWAYTRETLDMISGHYKTGERIPDSLFRKLNDSRNFMNGWAGLRQINFGYLDMAWHDADPSLIDDVAAFEDRATAETTLFRRQGGPASTSFGHLFAGGYSAGYYSYKWAEVLDADVFARFEKDGLYAPAVASAYQREILARGGSEHPQIIYRRFMERDADPDALLRREGLLVVQASRAAATGS